MTILGVFALAVQRILAAREAEFKRYMNDPELGMEMTDFVVDASGADGEFEEDFPGQHASGSTFLPQGY